jgi:hypothetical protein
MSGYITDLHELEEFYTKHKEEIDAVNEPSDCKWHVRLMHEAALLCEAVEGRTCAHLLLEVILNHALGQSVTPDDFHEILMMYSHAYRHSASLDKRFSQFLERVNRGESDEKDSKEGGRVS